VVADHLLPLADRVIDHSSDMDYSDANKNRIKREEQQRFDKLIRGFHTKPSGMLDYQMTCI